MIGLTLKLGIVLAGLVALSDVVNAAIITEVGFVITAGLQIVNTLLLRRVKRDSHAERARIERDLHHVKRRLGADRRASDRPTDLDDLDPPNGRTGH